MWLTGKNRNAAKIMRQTKKKKKKKSWDKKEGVKHGCVRLCHKVILGQMFQVDSKSNHIFKLIFYII